MHISEKILRKDGLGVLVHNFILKIKNLAHKYDIKLKTDMDELERDILFGKSKLTALQALTMLKEGRSLSKEKLKAFNKYYYDAVESFTKALKTLAVSGKIDKIDIKRILKPFLSLEIKDKR